LQKAHAVAVADGGKQFGVPAGFFADLVIGDKCGVVQVISNQLRLRKLCCALSFIWASSKPPGCWLRMLERISSAVSENLGVKR
jgi:hypothetical protein